MAVAVQDRQRTFLTRSIRPRTHQNQTSNSSTSTSTSTSTRSVGCVSRSRGRAEYGGNRARSPANLFDQIDRTANTPEPNVKFEYEHEHEYEIRRVCEPV
jgi:hypothetical protein